MNTYTLNEETIRQINERFSSSINDLAKIYTLLRDIMQSESVEILFYNQHEAFFYDKEKGTKIETKYLDNKSFLGYVYQSKKPSVIQNIAKNSRFNTAIDNPFKTKMEAQIVIPVVFDGHVEGMIRCSKQDEAYSQEVLDIIGRIMNSFKDIFLNERHQLDMHMQRHPFSLETVEVYKAVKEVKKIYETLLAHTQNPEMQKLIQEGQSVTDSIFRYLNPNMDNVSLVKNQLKKLNKTKKDESGINVMIADDVQMNVKILNSMLSNDTQISEIHVAYDGNETIEKMQKSIESSQNVDVLFLDHHMPGKLGLEIADTIKKDSRYNTVIVSITNDPDAIKNNLNLYDYHLSKPFSKTAIEKILNEIKDTRLNSIAM